MRSEIFYSDQTDTEMRFNAMTITKVGDATAGRSDEVTGRVEQIDPTANTFVVGDRTFVAAQDRTAHVDQLSEGDEVIVVYDTDNMEEPIQAISLWRTN